MVCPASTVVLAVSVILAGAPYWVLLAGLVRVTVGGVAILMVLAAEVLVPPKLSEALAVMVYVPAGTVDQVTL